MASTFQSDAVDAGIPPRDDTGVGVVSKTGHYTVAAALVVNDVIQMITVPANATILEIILAATDLDTDGTPAITLDVGDGDDPDRFIDGSTVGQAGGVDRLGSGLVGLLGVAGVGYTYAAEDTIDVKVSVAPDAGATGAIDLTVLYTMDD